MRLLTGFLWFLYKILVLYTLIVYALTYWTFSSHWIAGFMMMSLPVVVVLHLVFMVLWLAVAPRRAIVTLLVLLAGLPFLARTFQLDLSPGPSLAAAPSRGQSPVISVLNYNVFNFGLNQYRHEENHTTLKQFKNWLVQQNADVLCLQEYFSHGDMEDFHITEMLIKTGYRHHAFLLQGSHGSPSEFGLAVFSRYPILATRDTLFSGQNGLLQADIVWNKDTLRIINTHLYSMTLQLSQVVSEQDYDKKKHEAKYAFRQMRRGFETRAQELNPLEKWIAASPYPIIVCGDFNETPYSYVYGHLRRRLANAFEERGRGFGFSYNHLPNFIRIDNQFYDQNRLELTEFKTLREVPYSDHYPLIGFYTRKEQL
ncbi:endonuclease/exonuclease/phosphatase family protein [Salmonirosea aquatica]|uniref:Endonuclease/exonuclease/phosphatase n=1 Tax=Salmonirosea aquatica TaxID=2654236 RepID=A0A7C9FEC8_9BACT|nr:endonuclease/exonuclease/phosphatase [Cytophagaceae bacterium SJW1-29]